MRTVGAKQRASLVVALISALALALGASTLLLCSLSILELGLAIQLSLLGILGGTLALAIAYTKNTQLFVPLSALLVCVTPATLQSWRDSRTLWVQSDQVCQSRKQPAELGGLAASAADQDSALGRQVCGQLGKRYVRADCTGRIARLRCEP